MSVWPGCSSPSPSLSGVEGELVSVRVSVEPRLLERLLDVLARLEFPINPQIYHNAASASGPAHPATIVEFPAWGGRIEDVRGALRREGFDPRTMSVRDMLEDLQADGGTIARAPAPATA